MIRQFLIPVIEAQKKKGHYVCVCTSDDLHSQKLRNIGIDVFPHKLKRNLNPFSLIKEIFRIKRILIEQRIDVLICHSPIGAGAGRIAARLAKLPCVVYFAHGLACAPAQGIISWHIRYRIEKLFGRITDAILLMNDYDEKLSRTNHLIKNANKIFRISGMGVDLKKFKTEAVEDNRRQVKNELGIPKNQKILFCTAFLTPTKGIFVLLEIAKKICAQRNDVCFLLAGEGFAMEDLKKRCRKYKLENHFKILGWRDDIYRLMRTADVFVLPTYFYEGLPVSILEAMACGKPVIATRHRGCEDVVVDGQTGFLVPVKQISPLANKILLLLDNENLRKEMGQAGRQRVEQCFELRYCTERIVEALEKAIH